MTRFDMIKTDIKDLAKENPDTIKTGNPFLTAQTGRFFHTSADYPSKYKS